MDEAGRQLLRRELMNVLKSLTPREEAGPLPLRFGLEDGRARTLEELGKEFHVTRERVRQIEAKALRKLRHPSRAKRLRDYLEVSLSPKSQPVQNAQPCFWQEHEKRKIKA